jgi:hypothetical protein
LIGVGIICYAGVGSDMGPPLVDLPHQRKPVGFFIALVVGRDKRILG